MSELWGVVAAAASSALGGTSIAATRYLVGHLDPLAIGSFRFGIGCLLLAPVALLGDRRWPERGDWLQTAGLGLLFFALFPILFNASLIHTSSARGALALSTLPLLSLVVGAALGRERLTARKTAGVLIAMAGVGFALLSGLGHAPPQAWRGDLLMIAAALCMALYGIWSKPVIGRCGPIPFTTVAMAVGAAALILISLLRGSFDAVAQFAVPQWSAALYLGVIGAALTFYLWAFALGKASPTSVAVTVTVNPVTASLVAAVLLNEPIGWNLVIGIVVVGIGIWLATTDGQGVRASG
ncbi:EamA family transporter [Bosea sp. FBZP-16]|uniref:DMT family transporter n=1 Tax=Bosea sp. FBZP-16 TaxID=2065382 RepID=UPI000C318C23|nr:EamA family transporter [Bosea sp. FBZP-16]